MNNQTRQVKKTTQLQRLLRSGGVEFLMEAHNGGSATIVEEAGFSGIWGSGLSMSAALGSGTTTRRVGHRFWKSRSS